jgi:hypothetical protein
MSVLSYCREYVRRGENSGAKKTHLCGVKCFMYIIMCVCIIEVTTAGLYPERGNPKPKVCLIVLISVSPRTLDC